MVFCRHEIVRQPGDFFIAQLLTIYYARRFVTQLKKQKTKNKNRGERPKIKLYYR
jgi:hypothetical protein